MTTVSSVPSPESLESTTSPPESGEEYVGSLEQAYRRLMKAMQYGSGILLLLLVLPICLDIVLRTFFGVAINGIVEVETLALVLVVFLAVGHVTSSREHIQVDLFYNSFSPRTQTRLLLFANLICLLAALAFTWFTARTGLGWRDITLLLRLPEQYFILATSLGFACISLGMGFDVWRSLKDQAQKGDWRGLVAVLCLTVLVCALPFLYKALGFRLSGLAIGAIGFCILFSMILLRVPIGLAMCFVAVIGLLAIKRNPTAVFSLGEIPYRHTADFIYVAIPMFMLMGELTFWSGMSKGLFDCAGKWLGRMPGGLACASVAGCAGFGAVCGDSLATVITMSSVALPAMRDQQYDPGLATGALAAGGTLGILIPPSMGFIFYSLMTEESIGKLFIAGVMPGLLLTGIFCLIILYRVRRNPALAPRARGFSLREKLFSLVGILPIVALFIVVVGGILSGAFTPGEGGAVGAMGAYIYAVARRTVGRKELLQCMLSTVQLTGKIFVIIVGVYALGVFLASSRLPSLLAESVVNIGLNKYAFLLSIVVLYIILGCVMNIIPMMLLTLPALYPTVQALGFDGIWFGVVTVVLMEMGMITPPIGMNVFAMSSMAPDIPMITIFKGVLPFFLGMLLCVLLLTLFPGIALWLPNLVF